MESGKVTNEEKLGTSDLYIFLYTIMWLQAEWLQKKVVLHAARLYPSFPMRLYVWIMGYLVPHLGPGMASHLGM